MATIRTSAAGFPIVQGIELVPTHRLPDRLRSCFHFPLFNAMQSKCFTPVYETDENFVLSSPTGSGKTVILELAICRLFRQLSDHHAKIIYQAPTKSLCSERQRDWQAKFSHLSLVCAELTGDTEQNQLRLVQHADIIITTPEKWDSMTRKWSDHKRLMGLVKLFLIDEVHILKEDRGACLEAVVSRMKSSNCSVRFIALSATVPNSDDIATWLGRNSWSRHLPAARQVFGEEFRPVRLQKHIIGFPSSGNDFQFEQVCNQNLTEVISKYSCGKPIMVFCFTRKSTERTAQLLAQWWADDRIDHRHWPAPTKKSIAVNELLQQCTNTGVAFHHAGLEQHDRVAVEKAYLNGEISVICCTSTLAVGVNLPCHLVIIKNTVTYHTGGCKEYADLDIMQMLGRAGRPQFDDSAVAVIMTKAEKVQQYEKMISGQEVLESTLHRNLIEHLNAEVGLGTVHDTATARAWLEGTFFCVRFRRNPEHYTFKDAESHTENEGLERVCHKDLELLREYQLITGTKKLQPTEFGDAMARYYVQFDTMKLIMGLRPKAKTSEILSALSQASEFSSIRFRSGEKQMYKDINASVSIKFPIKVDLALTAHKVSLIIQSVLGGLELRVDNNYAAQRQQHMIDQNVVFQHVHRLIRCVIDCQLHQEDSVGVRNALELARSLAARAWDDSPLQMMQIQKIGPVAVRKLVAAGIKSIEDLENTDSSKIDVILGKNPPFGAMLLSSLKTFPKLRVSLKRVGEPSMRTIDNEKFMQVRIKAELGCLNDTPPFYFMGKTVHVCLLAETSDGRKAHFCRMSCQKLGQGQDICFVVNLTSPHQVINCYVSCDEIAGTLKCATLDPGIPASVFATYAVEPSPPGERLRHAHEAVASRRAFHNVRSEDFDGDINDDDFNAAAANLDVPHCTDAFSSTNSHIRTHHHGTSTPHRETWKLPQFVEKQITAGDLQWQPTRLKNGKWACNHKCKNKTNCKHICCHDGLDKPPKPPKSDSKESSLTTQINHMKGFTKQSKPTSHGPGLETKKRALTSHLPPEPRTRSSTPDNDELFHYNNGQCTRRFQTPLIDLTETDRCPSDNSLLFMKRTSSPGKSTTSETEFDIDFLAHSDGIGEEASSPMEKRPLKKQCLGTLEARTTQKKCVTLGELEIANTSKSAFQAGSDFLWDDSVFRGEDDGICVNEPVSTQIPGDDAWSSQGESANRYLSLTTVMTDNQGVLSYLEEEAHAKNSNPVDEPLTDVNQNSCDKKCSSDIKEPGYDELLQLFGDYVDFV